MIVNKRDYCSGCENLLVSDERCHYCFCYECGRKKDRYDDLWLKENWREVTDPCQECCEKQEEFYDDEVPDHIRNRGWHAIQSWETGIPERGPI